jgi:hypothetical protein
MQLPRDTEIYCGHEYTAANAKFALTMDPENLALQNRAKEVDQLRAKGKATLPTRLDRELETNPFLRPHVSAIRAKLGCSTRLTGGSRKPPARTADPMTALIADDDPAFAARAPSRRRTLPRNLPR